ncbi:hypothetical protein GPL15_06865 [Clostridium sp. MCC353]|uniref:anti-sigma-I factor RsgI family protein n=1 Tax=Clostridium sp. MCC353 TaxID=2592646 RepID=UPI001C03A052|nr:hypothetical protein [Clostridium sp. MCC353]MBT9776222.1 hypothetical protein [Clostridium sp. MCC353]
MRAEAKKKIAKDEIEQRLFSAVTQITPDVLDKIDLSVPQEEAVKQPSVISFNRVRKGMAAAAACLCLITATGGIYAYGEMKVVSVVGIDVNPGIELSLNRRSRILKAEAVNADGAEILSDVDIEGKKFDQAVESLVDTMLNQGYLKEDYNAVLVTVTDVKTRKKEKGKIRDTAVQNVEKTLQEKEVKAVVYDQEIEVTPELKELAQEYGISCGKAYFVQNIISENEELDMEDMEELSALNITQLSQEIENQDLQFASGDETEDGLIFGDDAEETEEESGDEESEELSGSEDAGEEEADETEENGDPVRRLADGDDLMSGSEDEITDDGSWDEEEPDERESAAAAAAAVREPEEEEATPSDAPVLASPSNGTPIASPSDALFEEEAEEETDEEEETEEETEEESVELEMDIEETSGSSS